MKIFAILTILMLFLVPAVLADHYPTCKLRGSHSDHDHDEDDYYDGHGGSKSILNKYSNYPPHVYDERLDDNKYRDPYAGNYLPEYDIRNQYPVYGLGTNYQNPYYNTYQSPYRNTYQNYYNYPTDTRYPVNPQYQYPQDRAYQQGDYGGVQVQVRNTLPYPYNTQTQTGVYYRNPYVYPANYNLNYPTGYSTYPGISSRYLTQNNVGGDYGVSNYGNVYKRTHYTGYGYPIYYPQIQYRTNYGSGGFY